MKKRSFEIPPLSEVFVIREIDFEDLSEPAPDAGKSYSGRRENYFVAHPEAIIASVMWDPEDMEKYGVDTSKYKEVRTDPIDTAGLAADAEKLGLTLKQIKARGAIDDDFMMYHPDHWTFVRNPPPRQRNEYWYWTGNVEPYITALKAKTAVARKWLQDPQSKEYNFPWGQGTTDDDVPEMVSDKVKAWWSRGAMGGN